MKNCLRILCLLGILLLPSCSFAGKHEITDLAIITAVGLDAQPHGQVRMSLLVQTGTQDTPGRLYAHTGDSISECLRKLAESCEKIPFFGHTEMIFVGPEMWEQDLCARLDWFVRSSRLRQECTLNAVQGQSALDFLDAALGSPVFVTEAVKAVYHTESLYHLLDDSRASHVMSARKDPTRACLIPCIRGETAADGTFVPAFSGYAILSQGQLMGVTQEQAAAGLLLLRGENIPLRFAARDQEGCLVKLEAESIRVHNRILSSEPLQVYTDIHMNVCVLECYSSGDPALSPWREAILSQAREAILRQLHAAAECMRRCRSDVAGFYPLCRDAQAPNAQDWPGLIADMQLHAAVTVEIAHTNQLGRPLGAIGGSS